MNGLLRYSLDKTADRQTDTLIPVSLRYMGDKNYTRHEFRITHSLDFTIVSHGKMSIIMERGRGMD